MIDDEMTLHEKSVTENKSNFIKITSSIYGDDSDVMTHTLMHVYGIMDLNQIKQFEEWTYKSFSEI